MINKEYAALTPDQLKAPAYRSNANISGVTDEPNPAPLYLFDVDYFDRTLPRTAVQLLVIPLYEDQKRPESDFPPLDLGFLRILQFTKSITAINLRGLLDGL